MNLGVGTRLWDPLDNPLTSRVTGYSLLLPGPLEEGWCGIMFLKPYNLPVYPPERIPLSIRFWHSKAMRPNQNSVTADGFHNTWRSKLRDRG
jgi:hypothetical protein